MADILTTNPPPKPKSKRLKTLVACNHCHRSHMTCDANRPCNRCVKKGLQDTCEDAPRKRKKYLADVPMNEVGFRKTTLPVSLPPPPVILSSVPPQQQPVQQVPPAQSALQPPPQMFVPSPSVGPHLDLLQKRSKFMSSAADLEYSTLSSIISDNVLYKTNPPSTDNTPNSVLSPAGISPNFHNNGNEKLPNSALNEAFTIQKPMNVSRMNLYDREVKYDEPINQYFLGEDTSNENSTMFPDVLQQLELLKQTDPGTYYDRCSKLTLSFVVGILSDDSNYTRISDPINDIQHYFKEPEDIYEKVNKPYSYTPGYHALIAYLRRRFNKEMLVKMAETMASYRPSFIACTNSLKEHDLIFMEQCFQRTLLTYDSIIKVSGTPCIVWRRTGEIAYVGDEFCILTGWAKEDLLNNRKRLIVELLDDDSVLEYFQLFSKIAFGDFFGATMTESTLLGKKGIKIKTRCSWTLKRDVFGIPMMMIGNFLPII